jgi:response regulator of citrate/malate metabolism
LRFLVIGDDSSRVKYIEETLVLGWGHYAELEHASTLSVALESLPHDLFDLILHDFSVGDGAGLAGLEKIRSRAPGASVLLLVSPAEEAQAIGAAMRHGVGSFILNGERDAKQMLLAVKKSLGRNGFSTRSE